MAHFSQSPENRKAQDAAMHVVAAYALMFKRMPTAQERNAWVPQVASGGNTTAGRTESMLNMLRMTDEYKTTVGL